MRNVSAHRLVPLLLLLLSLSSAQPHRPAVAEDEPGPNRSVRRGFTVPWIDLAGDTDRQVIVDREPGVYLGHPSTVLLKDGKTILVVYPKGHGAGPIVMKRSTDGGRSWSERLPVPENWSTSKETPTLYRLVSADSVSRLILFSGLYPIRMATSLDEGRHWTPLEPIGDFGGIVAMADVERLLDGSYMAVFHDDGRFLHNSGKVTQFVVYKTISRDGGMTWSDPEPILKHPKAHLCEPCVIRAPAGRELACLLRENSRQYNSMVSFSRDEGRTWSEPVELPGALTGDRHVARYAPDGRLVIVFRDMAHDTPTKGDFVAWVGTFDDIRQGREGQYRVRLLDNQGPPEDTGYAGLELLPDGTFVATTYCRLAVDEQPVIVSVRFTLDELDARVLEKERRLSEQIAHGEKRYRWRPLFDGKSLKWWRKTRFGGEGEVYVKDGVIVLEMGEPMTGITWEGWDLPRLNYEVELEAKRVDGGDFFCGLTFPVGDDPCTLIVGGWGGSVVGLSSLDGFDASENETSTYMSFENGRWYRIRLRVEGARIMAWIDGKKIVDVDIRGREIGIRPEVELSRPFGISTWRTTGALRNLRIRLLRPDEVRRDLEELDR